MINRRIFVFCISIFLFIFIFSSLLWAGTVGDNFTGRGVTFWGNINFFYNPGYILNNDSEWNYLDFTVNPGITYFPADNLGIWFGPDFYYSRYKENADNIFKSLSWGLWSGFYAAAVPNPNSKKGFVFLAGPGFGISIEHGLDDKEEGIQIKDGSITLDCTIIQIEMELHYFLMERFSLFFSVIPGLRYRTALKSTSGEWIKADQREPFFRGLMIPVNLQIGFSFWHSRKDISF